MDTFIRLQGRGDILRSDGYVIKGVTYHLTVWNPDRGGATRPFSIDGRIELSTSDSLKLLELDEPMKLALQDGRVVTFTPSSASVRITGTL